MLSVEPYDAKVRIMVLISGTGTNLEALIDYGQANPDCPYQVTMVVSDRPCAGLVRAAQAGIKTIELDRRDPEFNKKLQGEAADQDFIVLAGYLSILPAEFILAHQGRIINIHPSLLPKYGGDGMYGLKVHQAVLDAGDTESGCTVHLVDDGIDTGAILVQRKVAVCPGDTARDLRDRILPFEHDCIVEGLLGLIAEFKNKQRMGFQ